MPSWSEGRFGKYFTVLLQPYNIMATSNLLTVLLALCYQPVHHHQFSVVE